MPRHPEPFELEDDDFLKEYPTFDSAAFGEVDPPAWALRAIRKRGGKRHPRREIIASSWTAHGSLAIFQPAKASKGTYSPTGYYPNGSDARAIFDKSVAKGRRKAQMQKSQQQVSQRKLVPAGNLIEDDYRFWKGFALNYSSQSEGTCRWCQVLFKSRPAMLEHHNKTACKERLMALYRYAKLSSKGQRYCFYCKKETFNAHWGVPMCDKSECYSGWKFKFNVQLAGFQQYREWALKAQMQNGSKGPFGDTPIVDLVDEDEASFMFRGH